MLEKSGLIMNKGEINNVFTYMFHKAATRYIFWFQIQHLIITELIYNKYKVWVKITAHVKKLATILWNFVKIINSGGNEFHQVS